MVLWGSPLCFFLLLLNIPHPLLSFLFFFSFQFSRKQKVQAPAKGVFGRPIEELQEQGDPIIMKNCVRYLTRTSGLLKKKKKKRGKGLLDHLFACIKKKKKNQGGSEQKGFFEFLQIIENWRN